MKGIVSVLLIGSLAFVFGSSNNAPAGENDNKQQQTEVPSRPELSNVFPPGSVPLNPEDFKSSDSSPPEVTNINIPQRQYSQQIPSGNDGDPRRFGPLPGLTQEQKSGQIFRFEFPEEGEVVGEQEVELQGQSPSPASYNGGTFQPEDDSNNAKENSQQERVTFDSLKPSKKSKKGKGDFTSIQDFQNENRRNNKKQYAKQNYKKQQQSLSENGTVIEGAGTGFHPDSVLIHPELPAEGHGHHYEHGKVLHEIVEPHQVIIDQGGHHPIGHGHGLAPKELEEHHIYHPKSHAKPLKPSVVHRDPHDTFDHHDRIRTQDKDVPHHHHEHQAHHHDHDNHGHGVHEEEKNGFKPYNYDMHKLPECAHKNKHYYNLTFCLEDHLYPLETILWAIHNAGPHVHQLLSDVTYQSADNLVTGLTRAEEEGYTYKHYFGATHAQHTQLAQFKPPYKGYTYSADYFKKGGYICPSDIYYGRPKRAMNTYGKWKVIVNIDQVPKPQIVPHGHGQDLDKKKKRGAIYDFDHQELHHPKLYKKPYTQTLRLEQCIYPNAPCSYIDSHFHSSCIQKHNFVRLVAWTKEEGLHIDTFKMPIACSCHIRQPIHFYHETSHHVEKEGHVVPPVNVYDQGHHHDGSGLQHHGPPPHKKK